jgi:hypothetical protein
VYVVRKNCQNPMRRLRSLVSVRRMFRRGGMRLGGRFVPLGRCNGYIRYSGAVLLDFASVSRSDFLSFSFILNREESETITELAVTTPSPGSDALIAPGIQVGKAIRSFDDAYVFLLLSSPLSFA